MQNRGFIHRKQSISQCIAAEKDTNSGTCKKNFQLLSHIFCLYHFASGQIGILGITTQIVFVGTHNEGMRLRVSPLCLWSVAMAPPRGAEAGERKSGHRTPISHRSACVCRWIGLLCHNTELRKLVSEQAPQPSMISETKVITTEGMVATPGYVDKAIQNDLYILYV